MGQPTSVSPLRLIAWKSRRESEKEVSRRFLVLEAQNSEEDFSSNLAKIITLSRILEVLP